MPDAGKGCWGDVRNREQHAERGVLTESANWSTGAGSGDPAVEAAEGPGRVTGEGGWLGVRRRTVNELADMICGNEDREGGSNFQYRSSSYLTEFFRGLRHGTVRPRPLNAQVVGRGSS